MLIVGIGDLCRQIALLRVILQQGGLAEGVTVARGQRVEGAVIDGTGGVVRLAPGAAHREGCGSERAAILATLAAAAVEAGIGDAGGIDGGHRVAKDIVALIGGGQRTSQRSTIGAAVGGGGGHVARTRQSIERAAVQPFVVAIGRTVIRVIVVVGIGDRTGAHLVDVVVHPAAARIAAVVDGIAERVRHIGRTVLRVRQVVPREADTAQIVVAAAAGCRVAAVIIAQTTRWVVVVIGGGRGERGGVTVAAARTIVERAGTAFHHHQARRIRQIDFAVAGVGIRDAGVGVGRALEIRTGGGSGTSINVLLLHAARIVVGGITLRRPPALGTVVLPNREITCRTERGDGLKAAILSVVEIGPVGVFEFGAGIIGQPVIADTIGVGRIFRVRRTAAAGIGQPVGVGRGGGSKRTTVSPNGGDLRDDLIGPGMIIGILEIAAIARVLITSMERAEERVVAIVPILVIIGRAVRVVVGAVVVNVRSHSRIGIEIRVQVVAVQGDDVGLAAGQGITTVGIGVGEGVIVKQCWLQTIHCAAILIHLGRDLQEGVFASTIFVDRRVAGRVGAGRVVLGGVLAVKGVVLVLEIVFVGPIAARAAIGADVADDMLQGERPHHLRLGHPFWIGDGIVAANVRQRRRH